MHPLLKLAHVAQLSATTTAAKPAATDNRPELSNSLAPTETFASVDVAAHLPTKQPHTKHSPPRAGFLVVY